MAITAPAWAVDATTTPIGENVVGGNAAITRPTTGQLEVNQTSKRAVINWQHFNIGKDARVRFIQPDKNALAVNRVTGNDAAPTQILGRLQANGQVVVLDRDGVIFGKDSIVDVAGLVASSSDANPAQIMAGSDTNAPLHLSGDGMGGIVENTGRITIRQSGMAALVAPSVRNSGTITAQAGRITLAGGDTTTLDLYGDGLLEIAVPDDTAVKVEQSGELLAEGGQVLLQTADVEGLVTNLVSAGGTVDTSGALAVTPLADGSIRLSAGKGGDIAITGQHNAAGNVSVTAGHDIDFKRSPTQDAYLSSTKGTGITLQAGGSVTSDGDIDYIRPNDNQTVTIREQHGQNLTNLVRMVNQTDNSRLEIALGNGNYAPESIIEGKEIHLTSFDPSNPATLTGDLFALKVLGGSYTISNLNLVSKGTALQLDDTGLMHQPIQLRDLTLNGAKTGLVANNAIFTLQDSRINNAADVGLQLNSGSATLHNVTLSNNRIGIFLAGGMLDLQTTPNTIQGGEYGFVMDNASANNPTLRNNHFGQTVFADQSKLAIQLQNDAAQGVSLDATEAHFDQGKTSIVPTEHKNRLGIKLYQKLAALLVDREDDPNVGVVNIGAVPALPVNLTDTSDIDATARYLSPVPQPAPVQYGSRSFIERQTADISTDSTSSDAAALNALSPAAGGEDDQDNAACALDGDPASLLAGYNASCI